MRIIKALSLIAHGTRQQMVSFLLAEDNLWLPERPTLSNLRMRVAQSAIESQEKKDARRILVSSCSSLDKTCAILCDFIEENYLVDDLVEFMRARGST